MKTLQQLYDEYEGDFIDAMINRFNFSGKKELVFRSRFIKDNDALNQTELGDKYKQKLIDDDNQDVARIYRQAVSSICKELEEMGCPPSKGRDRWTNCRYWLREGIFPQWAKEQGLIKPKSIDECWQELKEKVNNTTGLTVEIPALSNMRARPRKGDKITLNSDLIFRVDSPKIGYLILFEREPNGTIVCLCPSEFAPESYYAGKETKLPSSDSEYQFFGSDELGWEQLVAMITPELPPFQWLEESRQEALEVDGEHLAGLLDYVNSQPNAEVLYTEYLVVAA